MKNKKVCESGKRKKKIYSIFFFLFVFFLGENDCFKVEQY